ncbi:MAG: hypothetical protein GXO97_09855 [Nitrospirae bacterium]|nr:hypothetical protein [Nitrospirota bacterium]
MQGFKISRLFFIISMVFVFSAGCVSHIKELREAQKEFNQAASLENQIRMNPFRSDTLIIKGQADASYLLTLKTLNNLLETERMHLYRTGSLELPIHSRHLPSGV